MANTSSSMTFIKREPDEYGNDPNRYMMHAQNYSGSQQHFTSQYGNQHTNASINPSELSMSNGNFGIQYPFGSQQTLSSSFNIGGSGFGEDELLESLDFTEQQVMMDDFANASNNRATSQRHPAGMPMSHQGQMAHVYSSTPDGPPPIQSPFLSNYDFSQFKPMNSIQQHMSPTQHGQYMTGKRPSVPTMTRKSSEQRSPMTPRTAAMAGLHIGTPESGNFQNGRPIRTPSIQNRQQKTLSGQYDSTPGSLHSFIDSPISSPGHPSHHTGISETLISGKHASLPAKVENGHNQTNLQSLETVEAKKRRRRASHNAVERRRRDNINERIQDLSHLVPQHRLDDDKVRKQLQNNPPMSPSVGATSMSPPNAPNAATSILAGASGRRAASTAGNITIGLPVEEKEKGPNKGDILNGAVGWTRDLMWALHNKYLQEEELRQYISQLNGTWPIEVSEDEKRMKSEVMDAIEKNDASSFVYSRSHGTGLRVPKHTNVAGERLMGNSNMSPQSLVELSPAFHSGGSGANSGSGGPGQPQYWNSAGHPGLSFKEEEEDELMDIN